MDAHNLPSQLLSAIHGLETLLSCARVLQPQTASVGQYFDIFYHSSTHHLYMGPAACTYTSPAVEVCPNATADVVSAKTPCVVPFKTAGPLAVLH